MAVQPEGTPCWADATFADMEAAKSFYGDVLGWTFGESAPEFGNYTQAYADGKAVAAVAPPMPGQEDAPSGWCLYLASPDVEATAMKIRDNGGEVLVAPMQVADFGSMLIARDPGGTLFGVWQANTHEGFGAIGETGSYAWSEIFTRDPQKSDAFFPAVFPYTVRRLEDDDMDFKLFDVGESTALGRMAMTDDFPPEVPSFVMVYFAVDDCDAAVERASKHGGTLRFGPMDSPFGRFAAITDPTDTAFSVIDLNTTKGEMPKLS
ncbi:MAG TPA: VOC family protein [Streptomyces sp.]|nr:VOC family protein [Streptomyces sp.]